jgi:cyclase
MQTRNLALSVALLSVVALAVTPVPACAQGQDFSKVEIKTTHLAGGVSMLEGSGGAIGVLAGPEGVFMVDDEFAPLTPKVVAAVKQISPSPIRFLVNTHVHPDHTGGNENFGKMGVTLISRDELRDRLAHPLPTASGAPGTPAPAAALPLITYEGRMHFHLDGEDVELIPIPRAHTDGDTLVFFHNADVIFCGDFFRSIQYPNIDRANGGSLNGMLAGLGTLIGLAGPNTKIVPGHGTVVSRMEVMSHRDMILVVRDNVAQLIAQGKSQDEVLAAHPTAQYDAVVPNSKETSDRFVTQLYAELKPTK